MQVTYQVQEVGGLRQAIIRTKVQDLFVESFDRCDVRRTTVDQAIIVVMDHAVLTDEGQAFRTSKAATPEQIIKAVQDDVFRPTWERVSETDEPIKRIGRPPVPPDQRSDKRPRSVRLGDAHWAKLQMLGTDWLEKAIDRAHWKSLKV